MIALIIALLLQLGLIQSEAQWHQLSQAQKDSLTELVIDDLTNL